MNVLLILQDAPYGSECVYNGLRLAGSLAKQENVGQPQDLEAVISLDAKAVGRRREEFFKLKLKRAMSDTGIQLSLGAELEGIFVGFLLARVYYGEFGAPEPVAVLDTMGVHPDFRGRGVGRDLIDQLRTNLLGLGIRTLQTEVSSRDPALLAFFQHEGFRPASRFCLDLDLEKTRKV